MLDMKDYWGNLGKEGFARLPEQIQRFLSYTQYDTTSDPTSSTLPSTKAQLAFADLLLSEFRECGMADARVEKGGVVMGSIPATPGCENRPAVGFIAHMDTSPEASGAPARWSVIDYEGGDVVLNAEKNIVLTTERFPEIAQYAGKQLIVTDGTTLLGADDKAGVATILQAAKWFSEHPEVPHAKLCFAVTPDEEIGKGTASFDIKKFGADYAYTADGSEYGGLESETFNAGIAKLVIHGLNVHPGSAKDKMVSAIRIGMEFLSSFPAMEVPEKTCGHEGFYHPIEFTSSVGECRIRMLIREHDSRRFEDRMNYVRKVIAELNRKWDNRIEGEVITQYVNMKQFLDKAPKVLDVAREAFRRAGVPISEPPVRGGTDGCRLCVMGLPTANYFTGGMNYHGVFEYIPLFAMEAALQVTIEIGKLSAEIESVR